MERGIHGVSKPLRMGLHLSSLARCGFACCCCCVFGVLLWLCAWVVVLLLMCCVVLCCCVCVVLPGFLPGAGLCQGGSLV